MADEIEKLIDEVGDATVGTVYRRMTSWPPDTELAFTDAGIFVRVPGVPGAYLLPDARAVDKFFRSAPSHP